MPSDWRNCVGSLLLKFAHATTDQERSSVLANHEAIAAAKAGIAALALAAAAS